MKRATYACLLCLLILPFCLPGVRRAASAQPPQNSTVKLVVDYSDGVQKHFNQLPWREGMTVLDALRQAQQHPRGISLKLRGEKATAFIYSIDKLENGDEGRGWLFKVNGELAKRSCGIHELQRGDTILWVFDKYR